MSEAQPNFEDRGRSRCPGITGGSILIDHMNIAIAISSRWTREGRLIILLIFPLAEAQESRHPVIDLAVHLGVVLVAIVANQKIGRVVAGPPGTIHWRKAAQHRCRERVE